MAATGGRAHFGTRRPVALVLRALVWLAMLYCSFAAYHLLAVADAATIGFSAPIFVAAFAPGALGERMSLGDLASVAVCFMGVVVEIRPDGVPLPQWRLTSIGQASTSALGAVMLH